MDDCDFIKDDIIPSIDFVVNLQYLTKTIRVKFDQFLNANTSLEQQTLLKELMHDVETIEEKRIVVYLITHMYMFLPSKHPIKKTCTRLMIAMDINRAKDGLIHQIQHCIKRIGEKRSDHTQIQLEVDKIEDNFMVILQGLFMNFPPGIRALNKLIDTIFLYAFDVFMKNCSLFEGEDKMPLELAQQMLFNSTRFLDTLLHHCDTSIHLPDKSTTLLVKSYRAICHDRVTFNTKSHCGALLVMSVVQCPDTIDQCELNKLTTSLNISEIKPEDNLLTAMLQSADCHTTRICIFSGIVHTCPLHVMSKYMVDNNPVAIYIFKNMLDIAAERSSISSEILEISRTLVSLSPLIATIKIELLGDMMQGCWDYIWMHLDHFVDAVRTDTQKLLKTFITITLELTKDDKVTINKSNPYFKMFTNAISDILQGHNSNFKALALIASAIKCKILLEVFPQLPKSLVKSLENSSVAHDVCTAYERLMEQHYKEMRLSWMDTWVSPILPLKHPDDVIPFIVRIFTAAFKLNTEVIRRISKDETFTENELRAILGCIITARKNDTHLEHLLDTNNGKKWDGVIILDDEYLQLLLCHKSAEIRILFLTLIVECSKTTEIFTLNDFQLLLLFFKYNSSSPFPNFRQNVTAYYKKALNRFKDSYYVIQRSIRNEESRGKRKDEKKLDTYKWQETYYKEFIDKLFHHQLIQGLFHRADNGKRALCLELFLHMKQCLPEDLYNEHWSDPDYVQMLFGAFTDTYESNLIMIRKLLLELQPDVAFPPSYAKEFQLVMKRYVLQIAFDVKPNVTTSATYAILAHIRAPQALQLIKKNFVKDTQVETCPAILIQKELITQMCTELAVAKKDILMAAHHAPIYGLLFCLRHLIQKEELDLKHPYIIGNIVSLTLKIAEVAAPIINSSAPEGYNPNNIDYEKAKVTPQLVLLYAWRTIKEVSLLFGELQIHHPNVKFFIKKDKVVESISKYFLDLFELAKHRGAYEQGFVGFSKFVQKLWHSECEWAKLPGEWLEYAFKLITSKDGKICETRRSAGIPFMILGILITEPKHRANKTFHYCIQFLLKIAADYAPENQKAAIHCMNTLRAVFRCNQLGEVVAVYVSQAVMIAIEQFSHRDWAVRNTATLMFSALMMRMFGVQRLKDAEEISIKNRLSFKVFTIRYPKLYKYLYAKLDEYTGMEEENVSLYPVLLILGRVYLTFEAKNTDNQMLIEHYNSITRASTRTIHKIRELAVKASVTFDSFLTSKTKIQINLDKTTNNHIHASLLKLKYLLKTAQKLTKWTLDYFKPLFPIINKAGRGIAQTNATLLMDILIDFLKVYDYKAQDLESYKQLLGYLHMQQASTISTCYRFNQTKFTLYLHVILKIPQALWYKRTFIAAALLQALTSRDEDMNIYALNCIRYINSDRLEEPEDRELEYEFVRSLQPQTKSLLCYIIRVHLMKRRVFMDLFDILRNRSRLYGLKVCQVLYNYPSLVFTIRPLAVPVKLSHQMILDYLDRQATSIDSDMFVAIMGLISKFVAGSSEKLNLEDLINHMVEFGGDDSTMEERLAICNFLLKNGCLMVNVHSLEESLRVKLWNIYFDLMQDEEHVVRDFCNQITLFILGDLNDISKHFPLIPERLNENVISSLPCYIGEANSLQVYLTLSLQCREHEVIMDETIIFDKSRINPYKESRPFASIARPYVAQNIWKLHKLDYKDKTLFLEEHFLIVSTKLIHLISQHDPTDDRTLCITVLRAFCKYLETLKLGTATAQVILDRFEQIFDAVVAKERCNSKPMKLCVVEVHLFLTVVLFLCREEIHYFKALFMNTSDREDEEE